MRNNHVDRKLRYLTPFLCVPLLFWGCTDLEETPFSVVQPDEFYLTEAQLLAAVIPVYANLRTYSWGETAHVGEAASDEIYVPTRGSDWFDAGNWQRLQEHTWTETDTKLKDSWLDAFRGIARANVTLEALENSTSESDLLPAFKAETRFLRAFHYWWLLDLFGNVPIVTDATPNPDNPPVQKTRQEVYDFIVSETIAALPDLKEEPALGRASKGAANALLATVYLNAEVYTGTAQWQKTIDACDAVINSGLYALLATHKDVFALENEGNVENIFVVGHNPEGGVGLVRLMATLHYSQLPSSPWNGFSVQADFYNKFDSDDARIDQLLIGQQFILGGPAAGDSAFQRDGKPLFYTVDLGAFLQANESHGVRMLKWPVDRNASGGDAGNDFAIFRYSHILLAKAEAKLMMGADAEALTLVNLVRERNFDPDKPLAAITRELILDERGFELLWESFRRQDQIRTGRFDDAWANKAASAEYRNLFPIPQTQMDANPNLVQNTGY
ncbi:MAG: RagB/SusD family nutrient uptake outer membrane protein [Candidatus Marinimicrobia bacterium]|nr:RagB/SusD family nutrient uptake outer membrane protein [Candidatus Neomarinimicrobiota bacterium]